MPRFNPVALALCLLLSGCISVQQTPSEWLGYYEIPAPAADQLVLCSDIDCAQKQTVQITQNQLTQLRTTFEPAAQSAEQERAQIATAIGLLERLMAPTLNTAGDGPGNALALFSGSNQLDCVAETSNTSVYLMLLEQEGLLRFHRPGGRAHRGFFTLHMPHNTATIQETDSSDQFVVDSWFGANGEPAWIAPVSVWLKGGRPAQ